MVDSDDTRLDDLANGFVLDDARILRGEIGQEEMARLEGILFKKYCEKAKTESRKVVFVSDAQEYERLRESEELFFGEDLYVLVDDVGGIRDMTPIVYNLLCTPEGLFYAKVILHGDSRRR